MSHLLNGFTDELIKVAGVGRALGGLFKLVKKHPVASISLPLIGASTVAAGVQGHAEGRAGGKGRYLRAGPEGPSRAAYTDYHGLFEHKPTEKEKKRLTGKYRESAFSGKPSETSYRKKEKKKS